MVFPAVIIELLDETPRLPAHRHHLGREHGGALDLGSIRIAARVTLEEKLPDMEIILRSDSFDGEIALPVLAEWCLFDERALRPVADPEEWKR